MDGQGTSGLPAHGEQGLAQDGASRSIDEVIETAYAQHYRSIYGQLLASTRDAATAQDLCQEAFLRLTRQMRAGEPPENVGAWLHRVATNLAVSRSRRARVAEHWADRLVERGLQPSPEDEVLTRERNATVRTALSQLSESDQSALLLAAQGYGGPEIARLLGRTQTATRTRLFRARSRLRTQLAGSL